ncbi:tegument protein/v-FGAM-synthetase [Bovine gammaherpesvirus 4]|uniref:Tegument protein/v-FGAM-synthetase n=2 Tax=Bovine herpesvirus 4 TaxID=10385 RepID=A0A858PWK3_BHV4|nr:tegument protein/v-FGAM-synthetase [Bovine gammaherpesvirus 4]AAK07995.1 tegument protein/v-FGAM-synthetase [Bovine gammaherpesvirus 4]QJC19075.1 tegument protein/v-FGAM-synthetase [Bovine gammaherpesvirus 4]
MDQRHLVEYVEADLTADEQRFISHYTGRDGILTLIKNKNGSEILLWMTIKENRFSSETRRTLHFEKNILLKLVKPCLDYGLTAPESSGVSYGPRGISFTYGPDLKSRLTTFSHELKQLLALIKKTGFLRVELARHLTCKAVQYPGEEQLDLFEQAFLENWSYVQYVIPRLITSPVNLTCLVTPGNNTTNSICHHIMYPRYSNILPVSVQASTGEEYNLLRYFTLTKNCQFTRLAYNATRNRIITTHGFSHVHSHLGLMVNQLHDLLFQHSIFPYGQTRAATCGLYSTTPSLGFDSIKKHQQIYHALRSKMECLNGCGIPVTGGFIKTVFKVLHGIGEIANNNLIHCSLLTSCDRDLLNMARSRHGQYVVCLGNFTPVAGPDVPPYLYRDSSYEVVKIFETLRLFKHLYPMRSISGLSRAHGEMPVLDHLLALFPAGGLCLFLSALPGDITGLLVNGDRRDVVRDRFLEVYAPVVFLTIEDKPLPQGSGTVLSLLHNSARQNRCPMKILGYTCDTNGIHFLNDLSNPVNPVLKQYNTQMTREAEFTFVQRPMTPQAPTVTSDDTRPNPRFEVVDWCLFSLQSTISQVLKHPTVGSKEYIVRHIDRGSNGLVAQQAGVGPLDVPVSDYSIICESSIYSMRTENKSSDYLASLTPQEAKDLYMSPLQWFLPKGTSYPPDNKYCSVMAIGEQGYKMINYPTTGAKYALCELLTNMVFSPVDTLEHIDISASVCWDPTPSKLSVLHQTMFTCKEFCRDLNIGLSFTSASDSIPMGEGESMDPTAMDLGIPTFINTMVFTGSARVPSHTDRVTPELKMNGSSLICLSISNQVTLAGSTFEHIFTEQIEALPDVSSSQIRNLFYLVKKLMSENLILSGHDISDGGLLVCVLEMALAGAKGVTITIPAQENPNRILFSEIPGVVIEAQRTDIPRIFSISREFECISHDIGSVDGSSPDNNRLTIKQEQTIIYRNSLTSLYNDWCFFADDTFSKFAKEFTPVDEIYRKDYGNNQINLHPYKDQCTHCDLCLYTSPSKPCTVAALVFPGCPIPHAAISAFTNVGFQVYIITYYELLKGQTLNSFDGLIIGGSCGSQSSYMGARANIMAATANDNVRTQLIGFFNRPDTFSLGCGEIGFQLLVAMNAVGTPQSPTTQDINLQEPWPIELEQNASQLYEARWLNTYIPLMNRSIMLSVLKNTVLPCWAFGTHLGVRYNRDGLEYQLRESGLVALTFHGPSSDPNNYAQHYPRNPTANSHVAGITSPDGRHLATIVDISLVFHPWQWQHIPKNNVPLKTSPWALAFQCLFLWCLKNKM